MTRLILAVSLVVLALLLLPGLAGAERVGGTNGDGLNCRSGPGTGHPVRGVLAEGASLNLSGRGWWEGDWLAVACFGGPGYVFGGYVVPDGAAPAPAPAPVPPAAQETRWTTAWLNLRAAPWGTVLTALAPGTPVQVLGGAVQGFLPVAVEGTIGYAHGDYLSGGAPAPPLAPAAGQVLADFALTLVGMPYVWNTHGPDSFDCSGFTYWVYLSVLGIDIGTGTWGQVGLGRPVAREAIAPGDLVFFQGTDGPGLSHVGLAIGGDLFVHAANETAGVIVSDLRSPYYAAHYHSARRLL